MRTNTITESKYNIKFPGFEFLELNNMCDFQNEFESFNVTHNYSHNPIYPRHVLDG